MRPVPTAAFSVASEVSTAERTCFVCRSYPELSELRVGDPVLSIRIGNVLDGVLCIAHAAILRDTLSRMMLGIPESIVESAAATPIPMRIACESCGELHIDEGEFATRPHHTHSCQNCGLTWRPAVAHTVGVRFLPGFKNPPAPAQPEINVQLEDILEDLQRKHPDRFESVDKVPVTMGEMLYAEIGDEYVRFKVEGWRDNSVVFGITADHRPISCDLSVLSRYAPKFKIGDVVTSPDKFTFTVSEVIPDASSPSGFRYLGEDKNNRKWDVFGDSYRLATPEERDAG